MIRTRHDIWYRKCTYRNRRDKVDGQADKYAGGKKRSVVSIVSYLSFYLSNLEIENDFIIIYINYRDFEY